jgi:sulfotransferase family protein
MRGADVPVPLVAVIGAPRSGTTWLQNLVGIDARVASPQETALFTRYVVHLDENWRWSQRGTADEWAQRRFTGLAAVLTDDEFHAAVRQFVASVLEAVLALKPGAEVVLEKTPSHSLHTDLIARYAPQARFVHVVRDGRDVAQSLVAASRGWGASWGAPTTIESAAAVWNEHVRAARRARFESPYLEVRYEDLSGENAARELRRVYEFCELPVTKREICERLHAFQLPQLKRRREPAIIYGGEAARHESVGHEPDGFYREGSTGSWNATWTTADRVAFDAIAGPLLCQLEYEDDDRWIGPRREVRRARRRRAWRQRAAYLVHSASNRLARLARRIE